MDHGECSLFCGFLFRSAAASGLWDEEVGSFEFWGSACPGPRCFASEPLH